MEESRTDTKFYHGKKSSRLSPLQVKNLNYSAAVFHVTWKSSFLAFHPQRQKGYTASGRIYLRYLWRKHKNSAIIPSILPLMKMLPKKTERHLVSPSRNLSYSQSFNQRALMGHLLCAARCEDPSRKPLTLMCQHIEVLPPGFPLPHPCTVGPVSGMSRPYPHTC